MCGAFKIQANPDAPSVVLPGLGPQIRHSAEVFARQTEPVPIFIKRATNEWEYVGNFHVQRYSESARDIGLHARRAARKGDVSSVLFLERVLA